MQQADNVRNQLKRTMEKLDLYVHLVAILGIQAPRMLTQASL